MRTDNNLFIPPALQHEVYTSWLENMVYVLLGRSYAERKLFKERGSWYGNHSAQRMVEAIQVSRRYFYFMWTCYFVVHLYVTLQFTRSVAYALLKIEFEFWYQI